MAADSLIDFSLQLVMEYWIGDFTSVEDEFIIIYEIMGKKIEYSNKNGLSNWSIFPSGNFFISLYKKGKQVDTQKLVKW
jgi:hypothetical protein